MKKGRKAALDGKNRGQVRQYPAQRRLARKMHHNGAFDVTFLHHRRPPSVPCLLVVHQALSDSSLALAASSSPASCS